VDGNFQKSRREMVKIIREDYGFKDERVLEVLLKVPRHEFVPKKSRNIAHDDTPVDIGYGQTMSQPYTVAEMTNLLIAKSEKLKAERVLEIGTGSGYQAAILSHFFDEVYTVEVIPQLSHLARNNLSRLGYKNVFTKLGSGEWGWKKHAPFDAIIVTAGVDKVPQELFEQLKVRGILVAPVGKGYDKTMTRYTKIKKLRKEEMKKEEFGTFHFVPFVKEKR